MSRHGDSRQDIDEIDRLLRERVADLVSALRGEQPNAAFSTKAALRFGRKGSLKADIAGRNIGRITDFSGTGKGMSPLQFIQAERQLDFRGALEWAAQWLGHEGERPEPTPSRRPRRDQAEAEEARDLARRVTKACSIAGKAGPVECTPAALYLRNRGVEAEAFPPYVRWRPRTWKAGKAQGGALVVIATTAAGDVRAVQLVHVTDDGRKAPVTPVKRSHGDLTNAGACVRLPGPPDQPVLFAEGPETGLSVWLATGFETWIALGGIGKLIDHAPIGRQVVVCRDADPPDSPADRALVNAVDAMTAKGVTVAVATPPRAEDLRKTDWNDILQREGRDAVAAGIAAVIKTEPTAPAVPTRDVVTLAEAERRTSEAVANFLKRARAYSPDPDAGDAEPPAMALRVAVSVGKTEAVLANLADPAMAGINVLFLVPEHALADEVAERFNVKSTALGGPRASVFRGRSQTLPDGTPVCRKSELAEAVSRLGHNVMNTLCEQKMADGRREFCEHHAECPYMAQLRDDAEVRFAAHQMGFLPQAERLPKPDLVVIDESFWQASLRGVEGAPKNRPFLRAEDLRDVRYVPARKGGGHDMEGTADLQNLSRRAADLIEAGNVSPQAFAAAGFTMADARHAKGLEWRCVERLDITPGMSVSAQRRRLDAHQARMSLRLARFWTILAEELEHAPGRDRFHGIVPGDMPTEAGAVRGVFLRWSQDLQVYVRQRPVLVLDATADERILRRFLPHLEEVVAIEAEWPHVDVVQVTDTVTPKGSLVPDGRAGAAELKRRANRREDLRQLVEVEVARAGGPRADGMPAVLAITYRGAILTTDDEPLIEPVPGAEFGWFNALRGRDRWRNVRTIIVAGRTQPNADDIESMAAALFYRDTLPITAIGGTGYQKRAVDVFMSDGTTVSLDTDHHPDQRAEAIRWQVCEAELIQAVGRGRPARRSVDRPLQVLLRTAVPLPIPVNRLIKEAEMSPSPIDIMIARGLVPLVYADMATGYPDLFPTAEAARKAIARMDAKTPDKSLLESLIGKCPGFLHVRYRIGDRRGPWGDLLYSPNLIEDPLDWVGTRIGMVTRWQPEAAPLPPWVERAAASLADLRDAIGARVAIPTAYSAHPLHAAGTCGALPRPAAVLHCPIRPAGLPGFHANVDGWRPLQRALDVIRQALAANRNTDAEGAVA